MNTLCPACQRAIVAGDIDLQTGMAMCSHCGQVFSYDKPVSRVPSA
jgi:transcription elongation factor Elf1